MIYVASAGPAKAKIIGLSVIMSVAVPRLELKVTYIRGEEPAS